MMTRSHLLPWLTLVLLAAACPAGKGTTGGESTADTAATTGTTAATTGTATGSDTGVTDASATQTTGDCGPASCDGCEDGCTPTMECVGSQTVCGCDCAEMSGSGTVAESTSAQETGTDTSAASTTGESGTTGEPAIACGGDMPFFPEFDRVCAEAADCALGFHQIDCCGSLAALGISADAAKAFGAAEAECASQYPMCDCAMQPTVADDGSSTLDQDAIAVGCINGLCMSFLP